MLLMVRPKVLARALLIFFLGAGLLAAPLLLTFTWAGAASAPQPQSATTTGTAAFSPGSHLDRFPFSPAGDNIVISEFRSRGPSPNNYDTDEFIELFNPTGAPITMTGWSLWRSECIGLASIIDVPFTLTLPPGGHYLFGGLNYSGVVPPDATVPIGLDDDGGIALIAGPAATDPVIDAVGMCGTPSYFEGTPLRPLAGNLDQSYDRKSDLGGSCTDTNNNANDFFLRSPSDPQNRFSPLTTCGNPTSTPPPTLTPTNTLTPTPVTPTNTRTPTATRTPLGFHPRLMISEVGWAGTDASGADQWIELYRPVEQFTDLDLDGWSLETSNGSLVVNLRGIIPAGGFYLVVRGKSADATESVNGTPTAGTAAPCIVFNRADVTYDQVFTGTLNPNGQILYLINPSNGLEDSADRSGGAWPAGSASPVRSMERSAVIPDTTAGKLAWFTFEGDTSSTPRDCNGNHVRGTPKGLNWAFTVTQTPSPTPPPTRKPTLRPPTPFAHVVINEFLPRPGSDWNQDGEVNVYDEFIELKNLGPIAIDLKNWKLDDAPNSGSNPFTLPSMKLNPGERAVLFGSRTHILLRDSGDVVRLLNAAGTVIDAHSYGPVDAPDQSTCRIPDGYYWHSSCFPTPGTENALTGSAPAPPPKESSGPPPCLLADTVPDPFRQAECAGYGDDIWSRTYWDDQAGHRLFLVPDIKSKWRTTVE
jgi:hypothetical protein